MLGWEVGKTRRFRERDQLHPKSAKLWRFLSRSSSDPQPAASFQAAGNSAPPRPLRSSRSAEEFTGVGLFELRRLDARQRTFGSA
jgi:hypothetical protein